MTALTADFALLGASRPSAPSLAWALGRMRERLERVREAADPLAALEAEAIAIHESDREANLTMAQLGVELIRKHQGNAQAIFTQCDAGVLASGGFGTALGVIRGAFVEGMVLTAWALASEGIAVTVSADAAAAQVMKTKGVTWVVIGADRIAANGDVASRIGTYQLAVCAMHHGVRFMVVAASSAIDLDLASGDDIVQEERDGDELLNAGGKRLDVGIDAFNPVFDVTPADLIDVIVTEKGIVERPDTAKLAQLMCRKRLH